MKNHSMLQGQILRLLEKPLPFSREGRAERQGLDPKTVLDSFIVALAGSSANAVVVAVCMSQIG